MSTVPTPGEAAALRAEYAADPLVQEAVSSVRQFGIDMSAATAATLLTMWARYGQLSDAQRRAAVAHFVPSGPLADHMSAPGGSDTMRQQAADRDLYELRRHEAEPAEHEEAHR